MDKGKRKGSTKKASTKKKKKKKVCRTKESPGLKMSPIPALVHSLLSLGSSCKSSLRRFSANTDFMRQNDIIEYIAKTKQNTPRECTHTRRD